MLRFTLLTSAVVAATFAGVLAFGPDVLDAGQRLVFGPAEIVREIQSPAVTTTAADDRDCRSPFGKIVAGLQRRPCP